jgi:1,4-dihydroxy-2-naphthoyl-CoA hydrolase
MSFIWNRKDITLDEINALSTGTLAEQLNIHFVEIGADYLVASMPVDYRTKQPFGLLHGGASAALAETIGSVAGWLCINPEKQLCVGLEINCNHIKSAMQGSVRGIVKPIHIGGSTHVWDIRITDDQDKLICISRLTMAVIKRIQR